MGKHVPNGQEATVLRELISDARRAVGELFEAIKEAKELKASLVPDFERIHAEEIKQLSNFFTSESNRHAADLNKNIERAREMIFKRIMAAEVTFDRHTNQVTMRWDGTLFDDQQQPPYPEVTRTETQQ